MSPLLVWALTSVVDILLKYVLKKPEMADMVAPLLAKLVPVLSRATEETPEETAKRLSDHDAMVAKYAQPPVAG